MMYTPADIDRAISKLHDTREQVKQKHPTEFWEQCVRDIDGTWDKYAHIYSMEHTRYFYGAQPLINYANSAEVNLLQANINVRHAVYTKLKRDDLEDATSFKQWLVDLRSMIEYRPTEDWKLSIHATSTHTEIVLQDVMLIAKTYDDPYAKMTSAGPIFDGFPDEALPVDVREAGSITHIYPPLEYSEFRGEHYGKVRQS